MDYEGGEILCGHPTQYAAAEFLQFRQQIVDHYVGKRLRLILDHVRIHPAKLIQPCLADHRHTLAILVLPPYSLQLNPIEGLWAG